MQVVANKAEWHRFTSGLQQLTSIAVPDACAPYQYPCLIPAWGYYSEGERGRCGGWDFTFVYMCDIGKLIDVYEKMKPKQLP